MNGFRRALMAIVALTLLVGGLPVLFARMRAEASDRVVSLVADYQEFAAVAQAQGAPVDPFLRQLHAAGVNALAVHEDTLLSLDNLGLLTVRTGAQLLDDVRVGQQTPVPVAAIDPQSVYVFGFTSPALRRWTGRALADTFGARRVQVGTTVDRVVGDAADVENQGIGYHPGELSRLASLGFQIVVRPQNPPGLTAAGVSRYFASLSAQVPLHLIIFDGLQAMGDPNQLGAVARAMRRYHLVLGAIETPTQLGNIDQLGIRRLSQAIGQRTVRVYSIPPWIIGKLQPPGVASDVESAIDDRHNRAIYLHPFTAATVDPSDLLQANVQGYALLASSIRNFGYQLGPVRPMPLVTVGRWERVLLAVGAVAGGLLLLSFIFPGIGWTWLIVLGLLAAAFAAVSATLSREVAALGAAMAFGGMASFVVARLWRHPPRSVWWGAVTTMLASAGVALTGALFVATLLGGTQHMLQWSYFRGVKVSYVAPPLLAVVGYLVYTGGSQGAAASFWRRAGEVLDTPLTLRHVLVGLLVLGAGGYYVLRSGNVTSLLPLEGHLRTFLQQTLVFRPREKEFLVGYPSLFLATLFAYRRRPAWFLIFLLGASAAFVSLIDSFEHLDAEFLTSFLRSLTGLAAGLVVGSVALGVVAAAIGWWERRQRAS